MNEGFPGPRHSPVNVPPELDAAIRAAITPDPERPSEIVATWTLILDTRYIDPTSGRERIRRVRLVPDGSDPHLSLGLLDAEAARLRREIA